MREEKLWEMKDGQGWSHQGIGMRDYVCEREIERERGWGDIEGYGERPCGCV